MYNQSQMLLLLQRALNGYKSGINDAAYIHTTIVDCIYDGGSYKDISIFKAYMLNNDLQYTYTFTLPNFETCIAIYMGT